MDKKYCIYCGAQNSGQAKFCVRCGKDLNPKENQLIDFLLKRTKDKFKGSAEDSLYEALKNFLLSHLYGTALTISFISAVALTAFAGDSHITEMNSREMEVYLAAMGSGYEQNINNSGQEEYPQEYNSAVHALISSYELEALSTQMRDASGNPVTPNPDKYRLPASYGYNGVHQLSTNLDAELEGTNQHGTKHRTEFNPYSHQTDIARRLTADGYTVGECLVETHFEDSDGGVVTSYSYIVVAVLVDGQWLVAEDRLLLTENIDLPQNEENSQQTADLPEITDVDISEVYEAANYYTEIVFNGGFALPEDLGYDVQSQLDYTRNTPFHPSEERHSETLYDIVTATDEFSNPISPVLRSDGYTVAEYVATQSIYDINNDYRKLAERKYCITCVEIDGEWYVAEDTVLYSEIY